MFQFLKKILKFDTLKSYIFKFYIFIKNYYIIKSRQHPSFKMFIVDCLFTIIDWYYDNIWLLFKGLFIYFFKKFRGVLKRPYFKHFYKTIYDDSFWCISQFDPRITRSVREKWYRYYPYLFKRFIKIIFWPYLILLKPIYFIKICLLLITKFILKYMFIF
jgi:hypothetical protein